MQRDLDIQEYTDPFHDPMIPHTLVLRPGLVIHSIYDGYWFWGRPSFGELRRDLREVTRKVRPDWDPQAPGLRGQWEERNAPLLKALARKAGRTESRVEEAKTHGRV